MYRLGLLSCDFVPDELRARFEDYPDMFAVAFAYPQVDVDWRVYSVYAGELPQAIGECDGYITTGSRSGAYDSEAWIADLAAFIRELAGSDRPLVGICFGHQLIAQALGGAVKKYAGGWGIGFRRFRTETHTDWMVPRRDVFTVPVCHQDQVVEIPPDGKRLASSDYCENFMIQFNDTMLGFQGHPEFSREYIDVLLELRREIISGETHEAAIASLERDLDSDTILVWIMKFLRIL